jgi:nitrite reductase/ring-hydroxylating ferredoxin subunit/DMSO/TMAO reductase YedYZ heme-binding membrane subunit
MTNRFVAVSWNRHKLVYDAVLAVSVALYLVVFAAVSLRTADHAPDPVVLIIRATGSLAFVLLHLILCVGPLARLSDRFAPILYNRRHLGVTMALIALLHALLVLGYYGGFGLHDPIHAVFFARRSFASLEAFPFELLGLFALLVILLMAATSHDFWLELLTPGVWKALHMGVYPAYAALVAHVALGSGLDHLFSPRGVLLALGVILVGGLHLFTGLRELARDSTGWKPVSGPDDPPEWLEVGVVDDIPENRAKVVCLDQRERVAIFRHDGKVSAVSDVCAHQGGPLAEGRIVDGCITCPWHAYQYLPHNGRSPPPYTERIPTYRVRIVGRTILLNPRPLPPGTPVEPVFYEAGPDDESLFEQTPPPDDGDLVR